MADTTNYFFNRPTVGGSENTWGADLNENWAKLDAILYGSSYTDGDANTVERIRPDVVAGAWQIDGVAVTATGTELNYVDGVTSAIQTQLDAKQALNATLTALAGVTFAADKMLYSTGADAFSTADLTSFARTLLDDANASAVRATLGIGDGFIAENNGGTLATIAESGIYYTLGADADNPGTAVNHMVIHCEVNSNIAGQFAIDLDTTYPYMRKKAGGTWRDWTSLIPIGVEQTWQDVSGSRSGSSTSYQNTTRRPITVLIRMSNNGSHDVDVSTDNSTWVTLGNGDNDVNGMPITFVVPPGHYYRYTGGAFIGWSELR